MFEQHLKNKFQVKRKVKSGENYLGEPIFSVVDVGVVKGVLKKSEKQTVDRAGKLIVLDAQMLVKFDSDVQLGDIIYTGSDEYEIMKIASDTNFMMTKVLGLNEIR